MLEISASFCICGPQILVLTLLLSNITFCTSSFVFNQNMIHFLESLNVWNKKPKKNLESVLYINNNIK